MNISQKIMYTQIVGFILGFMSAVGVATTCIWNQWSKTSGPASSSLLGSIWGFNGIWIQCLQYNSGQYQCDDYSLALFDLPGQYIIEKRTTILSVTNSQNTNINFVFSLHKHNSGIHVCGDFMRRIWMPCSFGGNAEL